MPLKLIGLVVGCVLSTAAMANEISETLEKPVRATLFSPNRPVDLEVCVADAITQIGGAVPVPLRNGDQNVLMLGYGHTPKVVIALNARKSGTQIEVRTRSGDMDDKLVRHLKELCHL